MRTLAELQTAIEAGDMEAAEELAGYWLVFQMEYGAVAETLNRTKKALHQAEHPQTGAPVTADVLRLKSLITGLEARVIFLEQKKNAFLNSGHAIKPPDEDMIEKVKKLSAKVAVVQLKADTAEGVGRTFADIAKLTNTVHS